MNTLDKAPKTLFEKVWQQHLVAEPAGEPSLLYIDLHLVHEVTSPQAFDGLRMTGRKLRRPDRTVATVDHNVPTSSIEDRLHIVDQIAHKQIEALRKNCADFGVELYDVQSPNQGIVHIIGPELGFTKPGMTIVCGDSHTSTHGAFGALAFGIGTSEVEHVMATQTLPQDKPKTFRINIEGTLPLGVTAKDIVLHIIGEIGTAGATGYVVEYAGSAIRSLSMEGRMTICNMSIEAGARAGMIAPDATTFAYLKGRRFSPSADSSQELSSFAEGGGPASSSTATALSPWDLAVHHWSQLVTDEGAIFDRELTIAAIDITPTVSWGTSPAWSPALSPPYLSPIPTHPKPIRRPSSVLWNTWAFTQANLLKRSRSTASFSAPAPTGASKTSAQQPPLFAAITSRPQSRPWSSPARSTSKRRPKVKDSTKSSPKLASTGASPAAACVSA